MAASKIYVKPSPPEPQPVLEQLKEELQNPTPTAPEPPVEPPKETLCIKSVTFVESQELRGHGQLGKISRTMDWLRLEEGFGLGPFSGTPGIWVRNPPNSPVRWENFIPIYNIAQISYENTVTETK